MNKGCEKESNHEIKENRSSTHEGEKIYCPNTGMSGGLTSPLMLVDICRWNFIYVLTTPKVILTFLPNTFFWTYRGVGDMGGGKEI